MALSRLLIHLPYLEPDRGHLPLIAAGPMFRVRLETDQERERETIIVLLLFGLKQEPADLADLGSDIVSKLVKVTIGNMLVITSGGGSKAVKNEQAEIK